MLDGSDQLDPRSPLRWIDTENRWQERLDMIAALIPDGASVLDLGCGAQGLRELVSGPYTPADVVKRSADSLPFDMEADVYPAGSWDVAVLSGVLEYATQPGKVLKRVRRLAPMTLLTYQTVTRPTLERNRMGFENHLSQAKIVRLAQRAGFRVQLMGQWQRQTLFRLT